MKTTAQLLENNDTYVAAFGHGELEAAPRLKIAVLTCMDARIDPARILGLEPGDAHVMRNAGGVVTDDVIRSLAISQHELGTEEIVVIQHTECGLLKLSDEEFARRLEGLTGGRPLWQARGFVDLEESVRESVQRLRADSFLLHGRRIAGLIYDVGSGRLREVT
jgi:carbonic anhydrase